MENILKITAMKRTNSKFYPKILIYKKKSMYDENELEMIQIDTEQNTFKTTLTKHFERYYIVTKDVNGDIDFFIQTIELDGNVIFNIEDYLFLMEK